MQPAPSALAVFRSVLRADDLRAQRAGVASLRSGPMLDAVEALFSSAHYTPSDTGFGALSLRNHPAQGPRAQAWLDQALRMLLAAWSGAVPSVIALLDQVVGLTIHCGPAGSDFTADLQCLARFPKLERLEIIGYRWGDPLSALASLPALTTLRLQRCGLSHGLATLNALPTLTRLTLDCELDSFGEAPSLPSLRSLAVEGPSALPLAPLAALTGLTELALGPVPDPDLRALSGMTSLRTLAVASDRAHPLASLAGLEPCAALESLDVTGAAVDSLAPLAGRTMRSLRVGHTAITSLDGPDLRALAHLDAAGTALEHLDALGGGDALETLVLSACPRLRSIDGIAQSRRLRAADLSGCPKLASLDALGRSVGLTALTFRPAEKLRGVDALAACTGLTSLFLDDASHVTDLSPLQHLRALERLSLRGCGASDLLPLVLLDRLRSLDLRGCERVSDASPLAELPALRAVALAGTAVDPKTLSPRLAAQATWSDSETLTGHPTVRKTVVPRGTDGGTRKRVAAIRKLLGSGDWESITQGNELLRALGDGALYDLLLEGVEWVPAGGAWVDPEGVVHHAGNAPVWVSNRVFGLTDAGAWLRSQSLPLVVGGAPASSARATALREKVTALNVRGAGTPLAVDLGCVAGLPALATLHLTSCAAVTHPEALRGCAALTTLALVGVHDPSPVAALPPSLRALSLEYTQVVTLAPGDAPSLAQVRLRECASLAEVDLSGAPALASLTVENAARVTKVVVHPDAPLATAALRNLGELRVLSVPVGALRELTLLAIGPDAVRGALTGGAAIERLDLSYSTVPDIGLLRALPSLKHLTLIGVKGITDLGPLAALPALETIVVRSRWNNAPSPFRWPAPWRVQIVAG